MEPADAPPNADQPEARRRRFSFSLRTLLIVVTLAGCGLGWLGMKVQEARRQQVAVDAIKKLGCDVGYDYQFDSQGGFVPNATPPGPAWLHSLLGDDFFRNVYFVDGSGIIIVSGIEERLFCDADLEFVKGLKTLTVLLLIATQVSDAGLEHLKGLTWLEELDLSHTHVSDAGLDYLKGLTQLKHLYLNSTQVSEAGVAKLQRALPNCQIVH